VKIGSAVAGFTLGPNINLLGFQLSDYNPQSLQQVTFGLQVQGLVSDGRLAPAHAHAVFQDYVQNGSVRDDLGVILSGALNKPAIHRQRKLNSTQPISHPLLIPKPAQQDASQEFPMTLGSHAPSRPSSPARDSDNFSMSGSKKEAKASRSSVTPIVLQSAAGYDWSWGAKPDKVALESMLKEILQFQFDGDPTRMKAYKIKGTIYRDHAGKQVTGVKIFKHYSYARWLADHPGATEIGRTKASLLKGYHASANLTFFFKTVMGKTDNEISVYTLKTADGYDWFRGAKPDKQKLEAMLTEILQIQFNGDVDELKTSRIQVTRYSDSEGKPIRGSKLLSHYSHARWLEDNPEKEDIGQMNARRLRGYRQSDCLEHLVRNVLGHEDKESDVLTLETAIAYDWTSGATPDMSALEVMLTEIVETQFEGCVNNVTATRIGKTKYRSPDNKKFTGMMLLRHYSHARWLMKNGFIKGGNDDIGQHKVTSQAGYTPHDSIKYFIRSVLDHEENVKYDYCLTVGNAYDWSSGEKPDKAKLEAMLKEIVELRFNGAAEKMNTVSMESTTFLSADGIPINGNRMIRHYSHARWLADHPEEEDIGQSNVMRLNGYRQSDSIAHFIRNVLYYEIKERIDYELTTGEGYNWSLGAKPDKIKLEAMLLEIFRIQFASQSSFKNSNQIIKTVYLGIDGHVISGQKLLNHYAHARWLEDHPDDEDIGRNEAIRLKGYRKSDSVAYFIKEVLGIPDFKTIAPDDIQTIIDELNIGDIVDLLIDVPAHLIEALSFLKPEYFQNVNVTEFVKNYIGLNVERYRKGDASRTEVDTWDKRRLYVLAVVTALEAADDLDLSEIKFKQQLNLLIRLSRKAFEQDGNKLLAELDDQAREAAHPFVRRLHVDAAKHFRMIQSFAVTGMRTTPYAYQREGTHFLASRQRAILADEAGLGKTFQATAAVQTLGLKRVLWITTASNKEAVRDDILEHADVAAHDIKIVISGDVAERKKQFEELNGERYIITNYETLVALKKTDPKAYDKLTRGLDVVIVDEAQLTDNVKTLRAKAVHDIPCKRRWLLSASPYQSKPERIWTLLNYLDPEKYPSRQAFKEMYTTTTSGLLLLHSELTDVMLRRTKLETMTYFGNPEETSFADQLADGVPRLPKKVRVPPEVSGNYALAPEQADLIAWMIADYSGWVAHFNNNTPDGVERIEIDNINALQKFQMIHKVIYQPEYFGLEIVNPMYAALDRMVAKRLARGEKVILWCWNTDLIATLQRRYARFGVSRIDGSVTGSNREQARHDFQNNPNVRIMDANYLSGGVGLTLTAAHAAIFVQLPPVFPPLYQAEGRHHRLIGPNKIQFAKENVYVEWMVPTYPEGFVDSVDDDRLREKLEHGTLVEQTRKRLEGGELLYNLVMEGYGNLEDLEEYFKVGVLESMGLNGTDTLDYVPDLPKKIRAYAIAAKALLPLWKLVAHDPAAKDQVLHLVDVLRFYPQLATRIGDAFQQTGVCHGEDISYINALFEIRNKYVREQIIKRIPSLIVNLYEQGVSLTQTAEDLNLDVKSPLAFLAQVCVAGNLGSKAILQTAKEIAQLRDSPSKRYIEEHFYVGVLAVLENDHVKSFLETHSFLFEQASLLERVHVLYRIGLLCRLQDVSMDNVADLNFDSWENLARHIEHAANQAIATLTGQPIESVEEVIATNPNWRGNVDPILALFAGYQEFGNDTLLAQAKEVFSHVVDNDLGDWRMGENDREEGSSIDYLFEDDGFWTSYAEPLTTTIPQFEITTGRMNQALVRQYIALIAEFEQDGVAIEGAWVQQELKTYRAIAKTEKKEAVIAAYKEKLAVLGTLLGDAPMTDDAQVLIEKYGIKLNGSVVSKESLLLKVTELRNLLGWLSLDLGFRAVNKGFNPDWQQISQQLSLKAKLYTRSKQAKTAEHFDALQEAIDVRAKGGQKFYDVEIGDTDDAAILTRMGALHPEMVNCFNPNGNPTFNQFVVTALASKNMRLVVVKARLKPGGPKQIVAAAMCKVKALEDDEPVLYLERGLQRLGYDFRAEMLAHLEMKKADMEERSDQELVVLDEVRGKAKDRDPEVYGIGAFTENEYVEPVFGLRQSKKVKHRGRIANIKPAENHTIQKPLSETVGIGMWGNSWESYVAKLKEQGVTVLVDVRGHPYMRSPRMKAFNRNQMEKALAREGIKYVWLGNTLGNPKVRGQRTMEGFRDQHMQTEAYQAGKQQLQEIMRQSEGKVALTCVEKDEHDCHRSLIRADV
jgi:hypothetical protein